MAISNDSIFESLTKRYSFMYSKHLLSVVGLCSVLALSTGCTALGFAVGAGAKTGIEAAKEGGLRRAVSDFSIQTQINNLWFQHDLDIFRKLDLTVNQGRVLITGVVQDSHHRVEAVRLAWQPNGVKQVINEIKVAESEGISGYARDVWIATQLKTKLTLDKQVQSINYTSDTVQGTVYLMGVASNQDELNRVIDQARSISGVKEVVSYVKFAGQPLTQETLNEAPTTPDYEQSDQYNRYNQSNLNGDIGQPIGQTGTNASPYSNVSPAAGGNVHTSGSSPMAQPEPYVARGDLPPPGQWATNNEGYPIGSSPKTNVRESVQVYPLND